MKTNYEKNLFNLKKSVSESVLTDLDYNKYDNSDNIIINITEDISNKKLEKLTFKNINDIIKKNYSYKENHCSTSLDILAIYLKGQKILYTESKVFCEQKLNTLMLPAIFISAGCTVLSLSVDIFEWGKILVSALNAFNAFLLAVISYLKLDAKSEAHKISAYKYDKLQSLCEFGSGKLLFFNTTEDEITKKIDEIETKVKEIKETNQFILPEAIRNRYPTLYSFNVFAEVKKIQYDEMVLINQLKNIINESITLRNITITTEIQDKLILLENEQNIKINEIILHRKQFLDLDDLFEIEIKKARFENQNKLCTDLTLVIMEKYTKIDKSTIYTNLDIYINFMEAQILLDIMNKYKPALNQYDLDALLMQLESIKYCNQQISEGNFSYYEILFLLQNDYFFRQGQIEKYREIKIEMIQKNPALKVHQFMMGQGKTSVITPLLAFSSIFLNKGIPTIITSSHLVEQTKQFTALMEFLLPDIKINVFS